MLLPFRQSIQSAVLKGVGNRSDIQNKSIQFPSWNDFPNLKELELETPWTFQFEPLPSDHPLQKLNAQHENFDALPSLVEGSNMRQISLQSTRWTASGELMARIFAVKMDAEKATKLWEIAKARGIRFEVSEIGGAFDDRDKAIAVAATLPTEPLAYLKMLFNQLPR
ncbi:hypothetical protein CPB86DRAFT_814798 [Serendipita vermifera]|nr:hypothetical protein CPB86DRAFT_814798 [Serendipita vermifera]